MQTGLILLALAYVLSQFFRAFLAVLTGPLKAELGVTPDVLATASGYWFLAFALMQLPVGKALDTLGPRRTGGWLFLIGGAGGAALFAVAQGPIYIHAAMALIGIGCSPVLMASFYIFAREFDPARFATLAALMIGIGTIGNLISSYPTAFAVDTIGWRNTMWALAAISATVALGILMSVRDPAKAEEAGKGSLFDLLRMPVLWFIIPIMFVNYAPVAAVRGLWIGPYLRDVFDQTTAQIGIATLVMSLAMILGTIAYGPLDRIFGTRKWVVFTGNALTIVALALVIFWIDAGPWTSIALFAAIGALGASFPVIIAHARSFFPPHLTGRGVTLMNLFGIGGVGVMQTISGRIHTATTGSDPTAPYIAIFGFFAIALAIGVAIYALSRDATD
ncbi:MFS transporter [Tateyamaria sp. ANG-S1]|uniref:MFS transporter n=1 Tax=Tateyamaria sp. ANG-S1 TaxID=1577905 RepID=UPI00057CA3E4|nr:MFS transporter [Tateyamaria sp. ANG-S1]KIC49901.1 MFS transporter [Tateyamaria sp. ANG-S1]